jgi:hypothetical protein
MFASILLFIFCIVFAIGAGTYVSEGKGLTTALSLIFSIASLVGGVVNLLG